MGSLRGMRRNPVKVPHTERAILKVDELNLPLRDSIETDLDRCRQSLVKSKRSLIISRCFLVLTGGLVGLFVGLFFHSRGLYDFSMIGLNIASFYMWYRLVKKDRTYCSYLDAKIENLLNELVTLSKAPPIQTSVPNATTQVRSRGGKAPKF
jgi:hypothetical protein